MNKEFSEFKQNRESFDTKIDELYKAIWKKQDIKKDFVDQVINEYMK